MAKLEVDRLGKVATACGGSQVDPFGDGLFGGCVVEEFNASEQTRIDSIVGEPREFVASAADEIDHAVVIDLLETWLGIRCDGQS